MAPQEVDRRDSAQLSQLEIDQWRDKKRYLWLMGLIAPDGAVRRAAGGVGVQPVGLARGGAGAVLDRPDPALHPAAGAGPAVRPGRPEPARRGDGAAGERQVLPLLHLHLHPVPVRQRHLRRVPVHRVRPELAGFDGGLGWPAKIGLALSVGVLGGIGINTAHEMGHKKDAAGALAVQDHAGADLLRPLLHRAQPRPPRPRRHPGGSRVGPLRRDVLGVPAAQRIRQPEVVVGAGGQAAAAGGQSPGWHSVQRRAQCVGDVGRALRRADRRVRVGADPVRRHLRGVRLHAAGDRQLPGALRAAAAEDSTAAATSGARRSTAGTPTTS